jgi:hypothetical protein
VEPFGAVIGSPRQRSYDIKSYMDELPPSAAGVCATIGFSRYDLVKRLPDTAILDEKIVGKRSASLACVLTDQLSEGLLIAGCPGLPSRQVASGSRV